MTAKTPDPRREDTLREDTLRWFHGIQASCNQSFIPLLFDQHRYLVLKGGGGSGKSIFAGRKILERAVSEPGHRFLVCRKVARTLRDSCFAQLRGQIGALFPDSGAKINRGDLSISFPNGSAILFSGLDDVEKLKSIYDITGIWVEEASELSEADFNQLDIRLRTPFPFYLQMILSFNPIAITHWLKARFFDHPDPRATVHESTYRDNRFLPTEAVATLEGFRETDPYYYMVYALGQWGVTGKSVFNSNAISKRLETIQSPVKIGLFEYDLKKDGIHLEHIRWIDDPCGPVKLYRVPEEGKPYLIGGDTAGDGSDWFIGQVLDNVSGDQAAVLRHQYDEDTYARQLFCLGQFYNNAMIAVETNFSTYPAKLLDLMGYPRQYVREVPDTFDGSTRRAFGFRTDGKTRPAIIANLIRVAREHLELIHDRDTLLEMLTFVRNDKLRPEAEQGAHDDLVMALAIAHAVRPQQSDTVKTKEIPGTAKWSRDMWEDFQNASAEERKRLIQRWGKPK